MKIIWEYLILADGKEMRKKFLKGNEGGYADHYDCKL